MEPQRRQPRRGDSDQTDSEADQRAGNDLALWRQQMDIFVAHRGHSNEGPVQRVGKAPEMVVHAILDGPGRVG
jgi:hypothetical protein